ncbi:DUF222 domain-containing protein [Glutamicibacter uratoxydans]|uniref:HNH endonuclease signature motif containing protein n=1 Tax=Glutamicibacter uratoxydans TaxID=43667 RepID=UPI003D7001F0
MLSNTPASELSQLQRLLHSLQSLQSLQHDGTVVRPDTDPALWRDLFAATSHIFTILRESLAETTDPRMALELATMAQSLQHQATRMALTAADRIAASNAHQLDPAEYEQLRTMPADLTQPARRCTGRPSFKNPAEALAAWLRIPYTQARQQLLDASDLIARRDAAGTPLSPRFGHLAKLFNDPSYNPDQVRSTSAKLAKHEPTDTSFDGVPCAPTLRHADGRTVEEHAAKLLQQRPEARESDQLVKNLIQDAASHSSRSTRAALRLGVFRLPVRNPRCREYLLRVSLVDAERIESAIAQANNPRTLAGQAARNMPTEGSTIESASERPDFLPEDMADAERWEPEAPGLEATPAERAMNALMDLLSSSTAGVTGRKKVLPRVIVHLQLQQLKNLAAGHARTAHGIHLPPDELRQLLCQAEIIPAVFNSQGAILDYGRTRRLVPPALREIVLARDRGCLVPGCSVPPSHLEIHHIEPWYRGGKTALNNLGPACDSHHHAIETGEIKIVMRNGLPHALMPTHLDPDQVPRRNTYWNPPSQTPGFEPPC